MNKPAAIPLFMYRKRQREAVLSDPSQITTNISSSVSSTDGNLKSESNADKRQAFQVYNTSSSTFSNQTKTGLNVQGPNASRYATVTNMAKKTAAPNQYKYNPQQPNQSNFNRAMDNGFSRTPVSQTAIPSNTTSAGFQNIETFNNSLKRNNFPDNSRSNFKCSNAKQATASTSGTSRLTATNPTIRQNNFKSFKNENINKPQKCSETEKGDKEWNISKRNEIKPTNLPTLKVNKNITNKKEKDSSLHIFTCSISSMKSWGASNISDISVMFEIYGLVDSATLKDSSGTGKEFMLRDDTSSIKCVFYEIDRELPRLIRGQVHRVIGLLKKDRLQVIHVRTADKEERQVCILASQVSQREMEEVMRLHNEQ